jgi:hypothetical protein
LDARESVAALELQDVPPRMHQDMRAAIAAALTARDFEADRLSSSATSPCRADASADA